MNSCMELTQHFLHKTNTDKALCEGWLLTNTEYSIFKMEIQNSSKIQIETKYKTLIKWWNGGGGIQLDTFNLTQSWIVY